jgi:hypothetical protein
MLTIEDLIVKLGSVPVKINAWDQQLVRSFADQINRGSGFTEKQGTLALKMLKKHSAILSSVYSTDITDFLTNPTYKYPFRLIGNLKKISIIKKDPLGSVIKVEFPYNEAYVNRIRSVKEDLGHAVWDKEEKSWIFSLCEKNLVFLATFAKDENFQYDENFENYILQITKVMETMEHHVPMLVIDEKIPKFVNIPKNVPALETDDILKSVFEARKKGIFIWDETISNFLDSDEVRPIVRDFLKTDPSEKFHVDPKNTPIFELSDFINYLGPSVFVIPGGSELEKLEQSYNFLRALGIEDTHMSVLFRLPSDTHKKFNDFVKSNNLNSPVTEKTQIVFISSKLPKPLLKSKVYFNSVINLGFGGVHYSIKNYVENHHNTIYFSEKSNRKDFEF